MAKEGSVAPKERINVTFKPATGDAQEEIELPLKLMVLGDFTHRTDDRKVEERKPISIDKNNFDDVLNQQKISLTMAVPNRLQEEGGADELAIQLAIDSMKDFNPASLNEVIRLVDTRCAALAERLSSKGKAGGSEVGDFMLMQMMNRTQLVLLHYRDLQHVHPEELYRTLLTVVGELSTFASANRRVPVKLHYRHSDLSLSFEALLNVFRQLMAMVLEEHATSLPIQPCIPVSPGC